jgi:hypothetical protein
MRRRRARQGEDWGEDKGWGSVRFSAAYYICMFDLGFDGPSTQAGLCLRNGDAGKRGRGTVY